MAAPFSWHGGPAMLHRHAISDTDWDRIKHLLPGQRGQHGGKLTFADDFKATLPVSRLEMPEGRFRWDTPTISPDGLTMTVEGVGGEAIPIDSATLRFLVDKDYAADVKARTDQLQPTREQLQELS